MEEFQGYPKESKRPESAVNESERLSSERASPLAKNTDNLQLIPEIIKLIYIVYVNMPLYPLGSDMVTRPIGELYEKLAFVLQREGKIIFSSMRDTLLVNGHRFKSGLIKKNFEEVFLKFFADLHLESLTFHKGLTKEELGVFAGLLARKKGAEDRDIVESLKKEGIQHITLDEIDYSVVLQYKKDRIAAAGLQDNHIVNFIMNKIATSAQINEIVESLENDSKGVADVVTKLSESTLDNTAEGGESLHAKSILELLLRLNVQLTQNDPANGQRYKNGLAKTFQNLKPALKSKIIFDAKTAEEEYMLEQWLGEFPDEEIIKFFVDAFKEHGISVDKIRGVVRRLSEKKEKESVFSSIEEKLAEYGLSPEDSRWIFEVKNFQELGLEEKIRKILGISCEEYVILRREIDIVSLVKEMIAADKTETIFEILNKWSLYYKEGPYKIKLQVAEDFSRVEKTLFSLRLNALLPRVLTIAAQMFVSADDTQLIPDILYDQLVRIYWFLIEVGDIKPIVDFYKKLKNDMSLASTTEEDLRKFTRLQEKLFTSERLKYIVNEYIKKSNHGVVCADLIELMAGIGETVVAVLIDEAMVDEKTLKALGYCDAYLRRRLIGSGPAAII